MIAELERPASIATPRMRELAFAALAAQVDGSNDTRTLPEIQFLLTHASSIEQLGGPWTDLLSETVRAPHPSDAPLFELAAALRLSLFELLTVALTAAVEDDPLLGRALARMQTPVGGARPTVALLATIFAPLLTASSAFALLWSGPAVRTGLLKLLNDAAPLPECAVAVPPSLCLALASQEAAWPGIQTGSFEEAPIAMPPSVRQEAARQADALVSPSRAGLLLRSGSPAEARTVAGLMAQRLGRQPAFVQTDQLAGLGPWLRLRRLLPVFVYELAPSEKRIIPPLPGYDGPVIALAGPDGSVENSQGALPNWKLPVPSTAERAVLWRSAIGDQAPELADQLARAHRHRPGRIAQLGRLARRLAAVRTAAGNGAAELRLEDIRKAAWAGEAGGLEALAEPIATAVQDEALVAPPSLRAHLELLVLRCRHRDALADRLGPAACARYRPGVKALFTGPSGTGKTLAAAWVATKLSAPLFRVDLASVNSKYIGDTEKNLSQLLARAEEAEVMLLFDEADSLFGKRTEIRDSNDRFSNGLTNYLLQRIENYDGLVLLTSNSKARFDAGFARRLDAIVEFHLPSADERRALWLAHLGDYHTLSPVEFNQLAALADVAGGHIRNAVLTAALLARAAYRKIALPDCIRGLELEFQKLGKQMPTQLLARNLAANENAN